MAKLERDASVRGHLSLITQRGGQARDLVPFVAARMRDQHAAAPYELAKKPSASVTLLDPAKRSAGLSFMIASTAANRSRRSAPGGRRGQRAGGRAAAREQITRADVAQNLSARRGRGRKVTFGHRRRQQPFDDVRPLAGDDSIGRSLARGQRLVEPGAKLGRFQKRHQVQPPVVA